VQEVDDTDLEIAIDEIIVLSKKNQPDDQPEQAYIEDVLPY
jgi:hypothetical protein